jgi:NADH dehydrogenase FAD-containing subunit
MVLLGVREYCIFLKQVEDAANLRKAISYCFERANMPDVSEEEKLAVLSFVIVGAGPTGNNTTIYNIFIIYICRIYTRNILYIDNT